MRFSPSFLDEIKNRLPVSQVVRRKVALKKQGREWRGLSPFTSEKTPSFYVNDQKMRWFCFSSGQNGNIFDFLMQVEGLSFPEAVEKLAGEAGVAMPVETPEARAREAVRATALEALELATQFFESQLQAQGGARARGYLAERGLGPAPQRTFRIGYAPASRSALREHLAQKNISLEMMIEAGLLIHGEDIPVAYDRFRDRVMFPIRDRGGRVIAFGGRALDKDAQAKYLNSPETPLFHKGANLYNQDRARTAAHRAGRIIAVEGYIDVIAMHIAGFEETVAGLGTALTPEQCGLLWRMADEPILCFDGDRAGRKAAFRAVETALPLIGAGRSLRFAFLPDGQDPDDLIRAGGGGAVDEALKNASPLVDVLWTKTLEAHSLDTPERRAAFERAAFEAVTPIADETLKRHYRQAVGERIAQLFGASQGAARSEGRGGRSDRPFRRDGGRAGPIGRGAISPALARTSLFAGRAQSVPPREALILKIILNHPGLALDLAEEIAALELESPTAQKLRDGLLSAHAGDELDVRAALARIGLGEALTGALAAAPPNWCAESDADPLDAGHALRQALALHRRFVTLNREKRALEAEMAGQGDVNFDVNFARLVDIQAQLSALDGAEAAIEDFGAMSGRKG